MNICKIISLKEDIIKSRTVKEILTILKKHFFKLSKSDRDYLQNPVYRIELNNIWYESSTLKGLAEKIKNR